jgi:hypothetical protein
MITNQIENKIVWALCLCAYIITVVSLSMRAMSIEFFYIVIISIFISVVIGFDLKSKIRTDNKNFIPYVFLGSYILLLIWLCFIKVIPEYKDITAFETKRAIIIYEVMITDNKTNKRSHFEAKRSLAKLYLHAPDTIERIEPNVNYKGGRMMINLLNEITEKNKAMSLRDDVFDVAEIAFTQMSKKTSKEWYLKAYEAGRLDALKRYNQRIKKRFKNYSMLDPSIAIFEE